jgi:hypothetical protein
MNCRHNQDIIPPSLGDGERLISPYTGRAHPYLFSVAKTKKATVNKHGRASPV